MTQPIVLLALAFGLGIIAADCLGLPLAWGAAGVLLSAVVAGRLLLRPSKAAGIGLLIFAAGLGIFWTGLARAPESRLLADAATHLDLVALVAEEGKVYANRETYVLKTREIRLPEGQSAAIEEAVLLQVYIPENAAENPGRIFPRFAYGDLLKIHGQLEAPRSARNPGEFDYQDYLSRRGIFTQMTVNPAAIEQLAAGQGNRLLQGVYSLKSQVKQAMGQNLPPQSSQLLQALWFGEQAGLSPEERDIYRRTGLIHVFSVSGFHVGFLLLLALFMGRLLRLPASLKMALTLGMLLFFAAMVGFAVPVLRAGLMAALGLAAHLLDRGKNLLSAWALAAILILLANPLALFDAGFQFSFLATWGLVYLYPALDARLAGWPAGRAIILLPLCAQLGIVPLVAFNYNQITVLSLLSNVLLIGVLGGIILIGYLAFPLVFMVPPAAASLFLTAGFLVNLITEVVRLISGVPGAVLNVASPPVWGMALYYLLAVGWAEGWLQKLKVRLWPVLKTQPIRRLVMALLLLAAGLAGYAGLSRHELKVVFLDVGQGDCIFIKTPSGKTALVDGGGTPDFGLKSDYQVGRQVVLPYLRRQGINHLDLMVNTHPDADHLEGLRDVLQELPVRCLVLAPVREPPAAYWELRQLALAKGTRVAEANRGSLLNLDPRLLIQVLHPGPVLDQGVRHRNNNSLVLRVLYEHNSVLLTGDVEAEAMRELAGSGAELSSQVLKVPHHGSRFAQEIDFLNEVNPEVAIISVGKNNFGHPAAEVLRDFQQRQVPVYRTDRHGAVTLKCDGRRLKVSAFKKPGGD